MTGADSILITEEAARRELWTSFASLVRSYVAAAQVGLDTPAALVLQPSSEELELVSSARTVRLTLTAGQANGYWVMYQADGPPDDNVLAEGAFRIGMDSLVEWTGLAGRQEMDAVAEALAALILDQPA